MSTRHRSSGRPRWSSAAAWPLAAVLASGCGARGTHHADAAPEPDADAAVCPDRDEDGSGAVECGGDDCDDADATVRSPAECDVRCGVDPTARGCPCSADTPEFCYTGPPGTEGVGICSIGMRRCVEGRWTDCENQVHPAKEYCDGQDNDCDGEADEGVTGDCGDCNDACERRCVPLAPKLGEGLTPSGDGCVTPASSGEAWVSFVFDDLTGQKWLALEFEASVPDGAALVFEARTAENLEDLAERKWIPIGESPPVDERIDEITDYDLYMPRGYLEVRVTFRSGAGANPVLCALCVEYAYAIIF